MAPSEPDGKGPSAGAGREAPGRLDGGDVAALREVALRSIEHGLETGRGLEVEPEEYSEALQEPGAVFVTLKLDGRLRGCVGSVTPRRSLVGDVAHNAYAAAFLDHRFSSLTAKELPGLEVHISRLTPMEPLPAASREELLEALRPGVDGLLLEDPPHRATFLPQVWENLRDPDGFLSELLLKAGLPPDHWSPTMVLHRYTVEEI